MKPVASSPSATPARRPLPRWKKALFGLLTAAGFFGVLEGLLVLVGVRPVLETRDPFVGFAPLPLFVETIHPDKTHWLETAPNKRAHFNHQSFPQEKAPGTFRVFCLGGSTTYGHPYEDSLSFAAWLRELLPQALPETRWEVINAGGISYASYRVAALMEELNQYEPDLFIIYSGHNEFLEERTFGDLRNIPDAGLRLSGVLAHTRTYAVLERLFGRPSAPAAQLPSEVDAALDHTVGPSSYHRDDPGREQVLRQYEFNLARMIRLARSAEAAVLLVTPASNLKDCSPFKSEHRAGLTSQQRKRFETHLANGRKQARTGDAAGAVAEYQAALKLDDRFAEAHYLLGRSLLALGRRAEAAACFRRALDEDVCPIRAVSEIPAIVRRVAREENVPVVDFVALLQNEMVHTDGHPVPGDEYFLDHVHLTQEATGLLSVAMVRELARAGIVNSSANWSEDQIAATAARMESRIDPAAQALALRNLAKVLNWAGKHEEAGSLALRALTLQPEDPESLVLGGAHWKAAGQLDQAIELYRRAVAHAPEYVEAHRLLGAALVERRRFDEALVPFRRLTELTPRDALGWHMCGAVLGELQRYREALQFYETALKLTPDDPHLHYNMGLALARLGRHEEAETHLRRTLVLNPDDSDAQRELAALSQAEDAN